MNPPPPMLWVFFGLSGRLGPAAFLLAGLLIFVTQGYFIYITERYFLDDLAAGAAATPAAKLWAFVFLIFSVLEIWSYFALAAKRMHDFGKPTALALIAIPLGFFLLPILPLFKGDPGPNRYGERPNEPPR